MISSDTNYTYQTLYNAWKEELLSKDLSSLHLNFIKLFLQQIDELTAEKHDDFIDDVFLKRIEFLIQDLINLRKIKIINSVLNKEQITTSYLSKQELLYYDYVKNSEMILQNKPLTFSGQVKDYIDQNSNFGFQSTETSELKNTQEATEQIDTEMLSKDEISVLFLQDFAEFSYLKDRKFGPFKKNDITKVPMEVFSKVLLPKGIAQKNI